jgi:glycosyltransferase involved in cell wall biosynthesis
MSERLRVCVVTAFGGTGGSESWLRSLLAATDELEVDAVLLSDGPLAGQLRELGATVTVDPVGRSPLDLARAVLRLRQHLRRTRPDVVLGNVLKAQLVAAPAARSLRIPSVLAKHDHNYDGTLARPVALMSTRVIAAVEELAEATRRADAVIIPPPRPARPPLTRPEARALLAAGGLVLGDAPVLAMAGRLVPFKAVQDAIEALAKPEAAAWELVVLGDDDPASPGEGARLAREAVRVGVASRVRFAGHVDEVSRLLAGFDALAILTRPLSRRDPAREGFGTAAFEAMLAGVPVVAVAGSAVARRLEDRAGVVVSPGDIEAIARALGDLTDPATRVRMGTAGRELTADHPDAAACARLLVDVLRDAAAQRRPDSSR